MLKKEQVLAEHIPYAGGTQVLLHKVFNPTMTSELDANITLFSREGNQGWEKVKVFTKGYTAGSLRTQDLNSGLIINKGLGTFHCVVDSWALSSSC